MMYKVIGNLFLFFFLSNFLQAASFEEQKKRKMIQDLEIIRSVFEVGYAPAEWKKEYAGWDLNEAFENAKHQVLRTPDITTKQFQQIVRSFMLSMKDYHVSVLFFSTEKASLPFSIRGIEGKYFINWVDPIRLPLAYYGLNVGDELLTFDERPVSDVINELKKTTSKSANPSTDQALAEKKLTKRNGALGDSVPNGSLLIKTCSAKSGKIVTHQLRWSYTPEQVKNPFDFIQPLDCLSWLHCTESKKPKHILPKLVMVNPVYHALADECTDRDGVIGGRKSFLPAFGEVIWSNEENEKSSLEQEEEKEEDANKDSTFWHAYIYLHPEKGTIGYIRIPHYLLTLEQVKAFGKLIEMMEERTDALVIDQLHNFGGFVHVQYMLLSMLTYQPLQAPYHRIKITQKEALHAYQALEMIKLVEMAIAAEEKKGNQDRQIEAKDESEEDDEILNFQELLFLKAYYELIIEEWNKGRALTTPTPILGVDKINPHPKYRYTKPILMLIDELDFSGGDFIPAILQDNQRALLFGARTAGAGGYVFSFDFPNTNGIASCSYTASIAERINSQKIENLGVIPDISYEITGEDIQNQYSGYIHSANQAIHSLLISLPQEEQLCEQEPLLQ